jgi:hypothetical protein
MSTDSTNSETKRLYTAGKYIAVFDSDIFLVSYPRSGNTWMRWLLAVCVKGCLDVSFPVVRNIVPDIYRVTNEFLLSMEKPRIIKSHETYNPGYPTVIYVYRDVRDVIVSLFYFYKKHGPNYDFNTYFSLFIEGKLFSEYAYGGWDENVTSWLAHSDRIAVVKFEDMLADVKTTLTSALTKASVNYQEKLIDPAVALCTFQKMRALEEEENKTGVQPNPAVPFIRKGTSGQWRELLTPGQIDTVKRKYGELLIRLGYETHFDW